MPTGLTTLDVVADQLNLHPKTLQRRLADEGTTFAALVDRVRKETAGQYLRRLNPCVGSGNFSIGLRSLRGCAPPREVHALGGEPTLQVVAVSGQGVDGGDRPPHGLLADLGGQ